MNQQPYKSTPVFDQDTLPAGLRRDHSTKAGTWGLVRVIEGEIHLHVKEPPETRHLRQGDTTVLEPEQLHWVEVIGPMKLQVEFHETRPS
jgi:tellurite resistance-related uncharacterized protein